MRTTCATRLRESWFNQQRILSIAPQCSIVRKKKIAPQTIRIGVSATSKPASTEAFTSVASVWNQANRTA